MSHKNNDDENKKRPVGCPDPDGYCPEPVNYEKHEEQWESFNRERSQNQSKEKTKNQDDQKKTTDDLLREFLEIDLEGNNDQSKKLIQEQQSLDKEDLQSLAENKNLELKSDLEEYKNQYTPLSFRCKTCGHEFVASRKKVKSNKYPCEKCRVYRKYDKIVLKKDRKSSELISIYLGDGYLGEDQITTSITLNKVDEECYVNYVRGLCERLFGHEPYMIDETSGKAIHINYRIKAIFDSLVDLGLRCGDKVKNQVSVPSWILENINLNYGSLKGLTDTDGSIEVGDRGNLMSSYSSDSIPLVEGFNTMCSNIGIKSSIPNSYDRVLITSIDDIINFLEVVDPEKIKEPLRRFWLGLRLIYTRTLSFYDDVYSELKNKISIWRNDNNNRPFQYSKENALIFSEWIRESCKNHGISKIFDIPFKGEINVEMTERALNLALSKTLYYNKMKLNPKTLEIKTFPENLRNEICSNLYDLYFYQNSTLSFEKVFPRILNNIIKKQNSVVYELSKLDVYDDSIRKYIYSLFQLIKEIIRCITSYENIWKKIEGFSDNIISDIIQNLKNQFLGFNYRYKIKLNKDYSAIEKFPKELREEFYDIILSNFKSLTYLNIDSISMEVNNHIMKNYKEVFSLFTNRESKSCLSYYIEDICILSKIILDFTTMNSVVNRKKVMDFINKKNYNFSFGSYTISQAIDYFIKNF